MDLMQVNEAIGRALANQAKIKSGDSGISPNLSCIKISIDEKNPVACAQELLKSVSKIGSFFSWSDDLPIHIWGMQCHGNVKGFFDYGKFKWRWEAKFQCPEAVPEITGRAIKPGRASALTYAVKDFTEQAVALGKRKPEDFNIKNK